MCQDVLTFSARYRGLVCGVGDSVCVCVKHTFKICWSHPCFPSCTHVLFPILTKWAYISPRVLFSAHLFAVYVTVTFRFFNIHLRTVSCVCTWQDYTDALISNYYVSSCHIFANTPADKSIVLWNVMNGLLCFPAVASRPDRQLLLYSSSSPVSLTRRWLMMSRVCNIFE